jgi:hypothetical protein
LEAGTARCRHAEAARRRKVHTRQRESKFQEAPAKASSIIGMRIGAMCMRSARCRIPAAVANAPVLMMTWTPLKARKALHTLWSAAKKIPDQLRSFSCGESRSACVTGASCGCCDAGVGWVCDTEKSVAKRGTIVQLDGAVREIHAARIFWVAWRKTDPPASRATAIFQLPACSHPPGSIRRFRSGRSRPRESGLCRASGVSPQ